MTQQNEQFISRIKESLDESVESLDAATCSRLSNVRAAALQGQRRGTRWLLPAGGVAVATLAVALLFYITPLSQRFGTEQYWDSVEVMQDIEMLSSVDDIEMIENLEFYYWLDEEGSNAG